MLVSGSALGEVKVSSVDGRPICSFTTSYPPVTCLCPSPERYNISVTNGYPSECGSVYLFVYSRAKVHPVVSLVLYYES